MTHETLVKQLQREVNQAGSQPPVASKYGISVAFLSYVLNGKRDIPADLAKQMGYEKQPCKPTYRKL